MQNLFKDFAHKSLFNLPTNRNWSKTNSKELWYFTLLKVCTERIEIIKHYQLKIDDGYFLKIKKEPWTSFESSY